MKGKPPSKEIMQQVRAEIADHLAAIEQHALSLEDDPKNTEHMSELHRRLHTMKGIAGMLEIEGFVEICHQSETFLKTISEQKLSLAPEHIDLLLSAGDLLSRALSGETVDLQGLLARFELQNCSSGHEERGPRVARSATPTEPESILPCRGGAERRPGDAPGAAPTKSQDPAIGQEQTNEGSNDEDDDETQATFLLFRLEDKLCAFPLDCVHEVSPQLPWRQIPFAAASFRGVTSLRGELLPVLDLARLLDLEASKGQRSRILFVESEDELVGCLVDRVVGVLPLPNWERSELALRHFGFDGIRAVAPYQGEVVSILDPQRLFAVGE